MELATLSRSATYKTEDSATPTRDDCIGDRDSIRRLDWGRIDRATVYICDNWHRHANSRQTNTHIHTHVATTAHTHHIHPPPMRLFAVCVASRVATLTLWTFSVAHTSQSYTYTNFWAHIHPPTHTLYMYDNNNNITTRVYCGLSSFSFWFTWYLCECVNLPVWRRTTHIRNRGGYPTHTHIL